MRNMLRKSFLLATLILIGFTSRTMAQAAFDVTSPTSNNLTEGGITVSSPNSIGTKTFAGASNTKIWKVDSKSTSISSTSANITKLEFIACYSSSGTSVAKSCAVKVSTDNSTFDVLSSGVTVSGGAGTSATSTGGIYVSGYGGSTTVTIEFATPQQYLQIAKDGKETWVNTIRVYTGPVGPVAVTGVSLNKTSTSIEQGGEEQLTATVAPSNADNQNVSWSSNNPTVASVDQTGKVSALSPGTATITVTTEDGNHTATCTVTVTAPPTPIEVTGISIDATATIGIGETKTLTVTYTPADANSGKALTWSSANANIATVDANGVVTGVAAGTVAITATSATNPAITASCSVTVQAIAVTGVSLNKSSLELQIGGNETLTATVAPSNATDKSITWTSSNPAVATVNNGTVNALTAGTTTITATTVDGNKTATCTVTVTATTLTLHQPEVYEAKAIAGGYGGTLNVLDGHEYEVYYFTRDADSKFCVATTSADKTISISTLGSTDYSCSANDGWFTFAGCAWSSSSDAMGDEFGAMARRLDMDNTSEFSMHISGFDQFAIVARDKKIDTSSGQTKPDDNRYLEVYIDDVLQPQQFNTNPTIRRYTMTTQRHVIRVVHKGTEKSAMYAFSLRVAQEPRSKWITGNDSTQEVLQTTAIRPVTYATKYNNIAGAETKLLWDGPEANGFTLSKTEGAISDTLRLTGVANCPVGTYKYRVAAFYNGLELNSVSGTFKVTSTIKITSKPDVTVYQNEDIDDPVTFRYYALSESDVQLTWTGTEPDGIIGSGSNGVYTIGGRPTTIGTYPYSITVTGGDTTFQGTITVETLDLGNNPILYLCKDVDKSKKDPVFMHLTSSAGGNKNLIRRKARREGMRTLDQYAAYKWILISEDVDADNEEVLAIVRGGVDLPVFNMKGFTYSGNRLGWGYPDNGTVDTVSGNNCNIYIHRNDHPIFSRFNAKQGDKLTIFEKMDGNGIMPIAISGEAMQNTLCLATGYTRDIDFYDQDGELQTAIHEIPARMRGGKKYICMPLAFREGNKLSSQGKTLIDAIVSYLLDNGSAAPAAPQLQINSFSIMGVAGKVNQTDNTIVMEFDVNQFPDLDLHEVVPQITLADPNYTFVTPASGDTVDFQYSTFLPVKFVVSDYISKREYNVIVRTYDPQGIENVYEAGMWVNIFDIYGRKIATTNEDIYSMELPRGVYLVVMENGETIKLMR